MCIRVCWQVHVCYGPCTSRTALDLLLQPTGAHQGPVADERPLHAPAQEKGSMSSRGCPWPLQFVVAFFPLMARFRPRRPRPAPPKPPPRFIAAGNKSRIFFYTGRDLGSLLSGAFVILGCLFFINIYTKGSLILNLEVLWLVVPLDMVLGARRQAS